MPYWGQFVIHDVMQTNENASEPMPIAGVATDATPSIDFHRLQSARVGGGGPRVPINNNSAFLDGSGIYGSSDAAAAAIREWSGGRLRVDPTTGYFPRAPAGGTFRDPQTSYVIGDFRCALWGDAVAADAVTAKVVCHDLPHAAWGVCTMAPHCLCNGSHLTLHVAATTFPCLPQSLRW
jgi:Animal haem peroxidase